MIGPMKLAAFAPVGPPASVAVVATVAGGAVLGVPWEVLVVVASLAVSWGVQVQQLNGFGERQAKLEKRLERLMGSHFGEARESAVTAAQLEGIRDRLDRIEQLLDRSLEL